MDIQHYTAVPTGKKPDNKKEEIENSTRKYFLRQLFVSSAIWTPFFAVGLYLGTSTIYIPQYRREANDTAAISVEMASWLSSAFTYASVPWCFILAFLTDYIGRKKTFIIVSLNQVLVATSYYLSTTPKQILISEILQGLTQAGSMNVSIVSIVEYTSPKNRSLLLTIKSATIYWGIWAANAIGTYTSWRYITVLGFMSAFHSLTVFFWPESPFWLAKRGRYEECRKSHRWLKGSDKNSEKELELLISTQIEERKNARKKNLKNIFKFLIEKEFYYPVMLSSLLMLLYQLSGKQVVTVYVIDIIKNMTSSESTAYKSMLILDGVSVFAMYSGCFLSKILKRRFLLFFFGSCAVLFLLATSLYLYLVHLSCFLENKYISVALLVGFSVSIGLGPIILATSLYGEMVPLKYKGQATMIIACVMYVTQAILFKNFLYMFAYFGLHGMFLFYGVSAFICLMILYVYLPETKDKTLQEIELYFKS